MAAGVFFPGSLEHYVSIRGRVEGNLEVVFMLAGSIWHIRDKFVDMISSGVTVGLVKRGVVIRQCVYIYITQRGVHTDIATNIAALRVPE